MRSCDCAADAQAVVNDRPGGLSLSIFFFFCLHERAG